MGVKGGSELVGDETLGWLAPNASNGDEKSESMLAGAAWGATGGGGAGAGPPKMSSSASWSDLCAGAAGAAEGRGGADTEAAGVVPEKLSASRSIDWLAGIDGTDWPDADGAAGLSWPFVVET